MDRTLEELGIVALMMVYNPREKCWRVLARFRSGAENEGIGGNVESAVMAAYMNHELARDWPETGWN